jgi:hypothetical protein
MLGYLVTESSPECPQYQILQPPANNVATSTNAVDQSDSLELLDTSILDEFTVDSNGNLTCVEKSSTANTTIFKKTFAPPH